MTSTPIDTEAMRRNVGRLSDRGLQYQLDRADDHFAEDPDWNQAYIDVLCEEMADRDHDREDPSSGLGCFQPS